MTNPNPDRTRRIFDYIVDYKKLHDGNSPTLCEIGREMGIRSTSLLSFYLDALVEEGLIVRPQFRRSRQIHVVGGSWSLEGV